jgi:hypothetical protein
MQGYGEFTADQQETRGHGTTFDLPDPWWLTGDGVEAMQAKLIRACQSLVMIKGKVIQ